MQRTILKKAIQTISTMALLTVMFLGTGNSISAQFTFMGDYDKTFAAPNGFYVDPQEPVPTVSTFQTLFYTGEYAPDGSIIAGGRHVNATNPVLGTFYIRKFNAAGAPDLAFGSNGVVRTTFFTGSAGSQLFPSTDTPRVLKVQPDGKILFAGDCSGISTQGLFFGNDACVLRYNADGSIDASFGNVSVLVGGGLGPSGNQVPTSIIDIGPGRFITQTGAIIAPGNPGPRRGTNGRFTDMAIQPDGKIVLVGETRNEYSNAYAQVAFIIRLNPNGMLDSSFGTNGMVQMAANPVAPNCYPNTGFFGVRLQADGRIIALGYDSVVNNNDCSTGGNHGNRFLVTRWTASGQPETLRHLDNITTFNSQRERATTAFFTRDGSKLIVSGSYDCKATLVRLNVADLSVDTTFGTNGIRGYAQSCGISVSSFGTTLYIKAIQPDGRIIGSDDANVFNSNGVVRFNPDGSPDQSFGNIPIEGNDPALRGRLRVDVSANNPMQPNAHVLVRPNGRINLLGYASAFNGVRAVVSQQNTVFRNGIYADFENDGKDNLAVYRAADGVWHNLDSRNNNYSAMNWGVSTDKIAPADYDGDGRADRAVYRDGIWYILKSSNFEARIVNFGLAGDLPRPGDFDGDGLADISVFRPSNGVWYRLNSSDNSFSAVQFGAAGDVPVLGDYDGDGKTDFTVFRPSNAVWYILRSSDYQVHIHAFGLAGDIPLGGDFNGDSRADLAVFRPSERTWYIARAQGVPGQNFDAVTFGLSTDVPIPADYDNDGKTDVAVYRNGVWWIQRTGTNDVMTTHFGLGTDKPLPAAYLP